MIKMPDSSAYWENDQPVHSDSEIKITIIKRHTPQIREQEKSGGTFQACHWLKIYTDFIRKT